VSIMRSKLGVEESRLKWEETRNGALRWGISAGQFTESVGGGEEMGWSCVIGSREDRIRCDAALRGKRKAILLRKDDQVDNWSRAALQNEAGKPAYSWVCNFDGGKRRSSIGTQRSWGQ